MTFALEPPPIMITISRRDMSPVEVAVIPFGEWCAHRSIGGDPDEWVVTHIPSGLRLPAWMFSEADVVEYNAEGDDHVVYQELDRDEAVAVARAVGVALPDFEVSEQDRVVADTDNRWLVESLAAEALAEVWS